MDKLNFCLVKGVLTINDNSYESQDSVDLNDRQSVDLNFDQIEAIYKSMIKNGAKSLRIYGVDGINTNEIMSDGIDIIYFDDGVDCSGNIIDYDLLPFGE